MTHWHESSQSQDGGGECVGGSRPEARDAFRPHAVDELYRAPIQAQIPRTEGYPLN